MGDEEEVRYDESVGKSEQDIIILLKETVSLTPPPSTLTSITNLRQMLRGAHGKKTFFFPLLFYEHEEVFIGGLRRSLRRVYCVREGGWVGVGWVMNADVSNCMICSSSFGLFRGTRIQT